MCPVLIDGSAQRGSAVDPAVLRARKDREGLLRYFGFRQSPFGVTPDPEFLFSSKVHRTALQSMIQSIESNLGFTVLLGEPGTGKTILLFRLLAQYRDCARTAFIFHTQCKARDLLRYVASELELPCLDRDQVTLHQALKEMLVNEALGARKVLIIIDEAQNLQQSSLEEIRLLSDFETAPAKLLHIILAGSSHLGETLLAPELSSFAQRVSTVCRLAPLNAEEVKAYVTHRLRVVEARVIEGLFSPEALVEIAMRSRGVPRLVNSISYLALSLAYATDKRHVSRELVQQAARDLAFSPSTEIDDTGVREHKAPAQPQNACGPMPAMFGNEKHAPPHSYETSAEAQAMRSEETIDSPLGAPQGVRGGVPEVFSVRARNAPADLSPSDGSESRRSGGPSTRRVRASGFSTLKSTRRKLDRSTVVLVGLILVALSLWIGWDQVRAKPTGWMENANAGQPAALSHANKDRSASSSATVQPRVPISEREPQFGISTTTQSNTALAHKSVGVAGTHVTVPVIDTVPSTLPGSKIKPQFSPSTESPEPGNLARSSEPVTLPFTTVPLPVPRLSAPVEMKQTTNVTPMYSLQPIKIVEPEYPTLAKLRHIEGDVLLQVELDSEGNVQKVRTLSGNSMLIEAATKAARQWRYPPFPQNQTSVPAITQIRFNFRLDPEDKK